MCDMGIIHTGLPLTKQGTSRGSSFSSSAIACTNALRSADPGA